MALISKTKLSPNWTLNHKTKIIEYTGNLSLDEVHKSSQLMRELTDIVTKHFILLKTIGVISKVK